MLCIALGDLWLGCSCSAMETHSMKLSAHCCWANLKATWSLEVCSDWLCRSWRPLRTMRFSIRWSRSVSLRGLSLCGRVAVVPKHFHFLIIQLTVDCGIFRSEEISRLDLLHRWHPITVPHWNSLSSWERPILSQMFVKAVCMPRCLILYTCGHGNDWNSWFWLFGSVSEYFWQYSVYSCTDAPFFKLCVSSWTRKMQNSWDHVGV